MITIDTIWAQKLPDDMKEDLEIAYDDYSTYMIIKQDGETIFCGSDYMEPEDATFGRDLKWVREKLLEVYGIGVMDGFAGGQSDKIPGVKI